MREHLQVSGLLRSPYSGFDKDSQRIHLKKIHSNFNPKSGANFDAQALKLGIFFAILYCLLPVLGKFTLKMTKVILFLYGKGIL